MKSISDFTRMTTVALASAAMFALAMPASAQMMDDAEDPGVAVFNESMHQLRVYAYPADQEDRVLLGWIGSDELEYFHVPEKAQTEGGWYRIAVQQVTPLPQIGVPAEPHPLLETPMLEPEPWETVRVVVEEDMNLSHVTIEDR
jgi:hypothetical protein